VACLLVLDFGLSPEEALPLFVEYNARCVPPWTVEELRHKLVMADAIERDDRGWRVRRGSRRVAIGLGPDGPVYVGVDCACEGRSYIDLSPSLFAGIVKVGDRRELAPELAEVAWEGRRVILTPPSTIATNKRETWGEFFLADLLRRAGAEVQSLYLPPLGGRRRTLSRADGTGVLVDPPRHPWEAATAAERAGEEARRLDGYRRSLPRQKASPKLDRAIAFVRERGVGRVTKEVLKQAKRKGITEGTLRRALQYVESIKPLPSLLSCLVYPPICNPQHGPIARSGQDFNLSGGQEAA
jgi:hypothetical protein